MIKTGIINTIFRGLTLGSKFLLLLYLARIFTPAELGVYGLMVVTISVSLYLLGLDFYTYNTREILGGVRADYPRRMRDQMVFHGLTYAVVLPALLLVFAAGTLPWRFAGWFYLLLLLEHLSQEAYRFLITLSRSNRANLVLFLRSGAWVFGVVGAGLLWPEAISVDRVCFAWLLGVSASIAVAAYSVRDIAWREGLRAPVDWVWIRRGTGVSLRFFAATISLLGIGFADRYFLQYFRGEEAVGIYTFFGQFANSIQVFVSTAVVTVIYPRVVAAWQNKNLALYRSEMKRLVKSVLLVSGALVACVAVGISPILSLVDKPIYTEHVDIFWLLLAASTLLALSYIPHYALYARNHDRTLIAASLFGLAAGIGAHALLVPALGERGAAMGTLIAISTMALIKAIAFFRIRRDESPRRIFRLRRPGESRKTIVAREAVRTDV